MITEVWDTRLPPSPEFLARWSTLASRAPQFNFTMDARYLAHEAERGHHAIAAIAGGEFLLVVRREGSRLVCGYPWRWQAADVDPPASLVLRPNLARCRTWFEAARELAGIERLRVYLPAPPSRTPGFAAGRTLLVTLDRDDAALLAAMDTNKRRAIKKAAKDGWSIVRATRDEQMRAFHALQLEENRWRGEAAQPAGDAEPWREWHLPWALLLVGERESTVGAGSGFACVPGGAIDYRTNASQAEARKAGVNAALAFEALRSARAEGCRVMNWGGVTEFKREMGGERVEIHCWLGANGAWAIPDRLERTQITTRRWLAARWKELRGKRTSPP